MLRERQCEDPGLVRDLPRPFGRSRIVPKDNGACSIADYVPKGRDQMVDLNWSDLETVRFHRHLDLEKIEMQEGRHLPGECDEVGPHNVVENVLLHTVEGCGASVNTRAILSRSPGVLYKDRQIGRLAV